MFVNSSLEALRSGGALYDLSARYRKYKRVHKRFSRRAKSDVWEKAFQNWCGIGEPGSDDRPALERAHPKGDYGLEERG